MKDTYLRAAAVLTLALSLLVPASATSAPTTDHDRAGFTARPMVKARITLSPVGDRLTGAKIPIKGYLSGNSEQATKVITLQRKVNGKWRTKATKKRKANGAYSFKAQVVRAPGIVKYRTRVWFKGRLLDTSRTVRVKVVEDPNTPSTPPTRPAPMLQQRVIDGEKHCEVLEVQTLSQQRTNTWRWDGDSWEPNWSAWTTTSEGVRAASAEDCLFIVGTPPADAQLPDMRMRNLDVCSPTEKDWDDDTVKDCFKVVNPAPAVAGFPHLTGRKLLKFPILTLNVGAGPSEIIADRSAANATDWKAYQTFYDAEGNRESVHKPAAEFYFAGDGHSHWHVKDFDSYTVTAPDGTVRTAEKHGYCLEDNTSWGGMRGLPGVPSEPVYVHAKVCGLGLPNALTIIHGMSRGWGDTYPSTLPDQAIDITDLPDGVYTVAVTADDKDVVTESNESNNTASVQVTIAGDEATVVPDTATGGIP